MNLEIIKNSEEYRKAKQFVESIENAENIIILEMSEEEFEGFVDAIEQLDELSKGTLKSYVTKAYKNRTAHTNIANKLGSMKHAEKAAKRSAGIHTAMKKAS